MKMTYSTRQILAISAVALGVAGSAFAMPPRDDAPGGADRRSAMSERHMMHGMKGMARLHDELKLDAKQDALWQDADKAGKEAMSGMRERMGKHHDEMQALISQPGADLRAIAKRMDEFRAEGQKLRDAGRDRWLAVYDALNPEQKEKARLFFKAKLDRMDDFGRRDDGGKHRR